METTHATNERQLVELDALVVGAGFGGVYQLKRLRDLGYKVRLVEMGSDYGGVWFWNRYPGARVDSSVPFYEFDDPALWKDWSWKQRFPNSVELRAYFARVADKWELRKDTQFNTRVTSATWDKEELKWTIHTQQGGSFKARYFLLNTGFATKRHIPDWPGLDSFQGALLHPSYWPHQEPDVRGKRVALVGTGATAVQIAQALAPVAGELVVFQRTPALALPMGQVDYRLDDGEDGGGGAREQAHPKEAYPALYRGRTASFGGFDFGFLDRGTFADPPAARRAQYEQLWQQGDFRFWVGTYNDMLFDKAANDEAYAFWRDKTRARIRDPRVRDLLAPAAPPFPFGCKRIPLEQGYYELFDQPHVSLVDVRAAPIQALTARGVRTSDGKEWGPFDLLICATGYDAFAGGLTDIDIRGGTDDENESTTTTKTLKEHWKDGPYTYLGMASAGFPNMFFTYGPQAPTAFCNGPTCAQAQGDWIAALIQHVDKKKEGKRAVEALRGSEAQWRQTVLDLGNATLLPGAKSWYMGDNIPGKPREPYIYLGGVPTYVKTINEVAQNDYEGFRFI